MYKSSPIAVRNRSFSSTSSGSSSPRSGTDRRKSGVPQVEVGAPCMRCGRGCEGLLLHVWRKICINCRCPREIHQVTSFDPLQRGFEKLSLGERQEESNLLDYVWYPQGVTNDMVKRYMSSIPYTPIRGSEGEKRRNKSYLMQLPPHDLDPDVCHKLTDVERKRLVRIADKSKTRAYGVGNVEMVHMKETKVCCDCKEVIKPGMIYISSNRAPSEQVWHPACFCCSECSDLLVDLIHFYDEDNQKLYCGRHYLELKVPRCFGCDELIVADTYTEAEGKKWHKQHFCCERCDDPLQGRKYGNYEGRILCERCFNKHAADSCTRCHMSLSLGTKTVNKLGLSFHEGCFVCKRCRESLYDRKHYLAEGDVLCDECIQPVAQCCACKEGILPIVDFLTHESRAWHSECFCCISCRRSLVDQGFHDYDGNLMCEDCYLQKISKKCFNCHKPITGKGIQFNFSVFHSDCWVCTDCRKPLSGKKAQEKNGEPYCQACILKFAKKCVSCQGPITSRHTIYKKKPYHLSCFKCTKCGIPIGNKSYYETSLNDLLCEQCAERDD